MADVLSLATYRAARRQGAPVCHALVTARAVAAALADLDAAGDMPASWLENSPRPEPCSNTTPGSPTVA